MKKLTYLIVIALGGYALYSSDWKPNWSLLKEKVTVGIKELTALKADTDTLTAVNNDMREEMYEVLMLMNDITINTMKLEQMGEGHQQQKTSMKEQLEQKMQLLEQKLAEARSGVRENAELLAEVNRLQQSFRQREQTISRLKVESSNLDTEIQRAIDDLQVEVDKLTDVNSQLMTKNNELCSTISLRRSLEIDGWIFAGDQLVEAARIIPKANASWLAGKQSQEVTRSKLNVLRDATECYNSATRRAHDIHDISRRESATAKARQADALFRLVQNNESIGEDRYSQYDD